MPKKFEWGAEFSVGLPILDTQHKKLFRLANDLMDCCLMGDPEKSSRHHELLNELVEYAKIHFATEEKILAEIGYQELECHKQEHDEFEERLAMILVNVALNKKQVEETTAFIASWCIDHIAKSDLRYKQALAQYVIS